MSAPVAAPSYAGLVTRAIAFAIDAAIVNGAGAVVGIVVGLALSILNTPKEVNYVLVALGGVLFVLWIVVYFVSFWSTTGRTPGMRVMRIRVLSGWRAASRALVRMAARHSAICCGST